MLADNLGRFFLGLQSLGSIMSAFLFVATALVVPVHSSANGSAGSGRNSRFSARSARAQLVSGTLKSSDSTSSTKPKKIFDTATFQYVDVKDMMTPFEQELQSYEDKVRNYKQSDGFGPLTEILNRESRDEPNSHGNNLRLLTKHGLEHMRFCYFNQFEPDLEVAQNMASTSSPPYSHNEKLAMSNSLGITTSTPEDLRLSDEFILNTSAIRTVLHQPLFWNDVYLDMKMAPHSYYDWLPNRVVAQKFVVDLADVGLLHVHCISCNLKGGRNLNAKGNFNTNGNLNTRRNLNTKGYLNADEVFELKKHQYFYFGARGQEKLTTLKKNAYDDFLVHMRHYLIEIQKADVRTIIKVLIQCVCDNLLIQYYGRRDGERILEHLSEYMILIAEIMLGIPSGATEIPTNPMTPTKKTQMSAKVLRPQTPNYATPNMIPKDSRTDKADYMPEKEIVPSLIGDERRWPSTSSSMETLATDPSSNHSQPHPLH